MSVKRWNPVRGYEGYYEVSDAGDVRSLDRLCSDGRTYPGKVLGQRLNARGYLRVALSKGCKKQDVSVHSIVLEAFVGPRLDGMESCHRNGVRTDNRVENLRWGTKLSNAADKRIHGTMVAGSKHPRAKITDSDVVKIRRMHASGKQPKYLASIFNLSSSAIRHIVSRRTWVNL